ncbi:MAG: hypothetical protein LBC59_02160 [Chitinispirillales bacterium]|jgi:uncharacterized protein (TIGR02145 family)|nr:hypothetical protein [Chitinispirillales bacterium]
MRGLVRKTVIVAVVVVLHLLVLAAVTYPASIMLGAFLIIDVSISLEKIPSLLSLHSKKAPASVTYDTFIDSRDGKKYRTVKMPDGRIWMAENLDYQTGNSWYYKDIFFGIPVHYKEYGRLYDWETAINACPDGWRVPFFEEWDSLALAVGGVRKSNPHRSITWDGVGKKLKAKGGWSKPYKGTDDYGFSALPSGNLPINGYHIGIFESRNSAGNYGYEGHWWTATKHDLGDVYVIEIIDSYTAYIGNKNDGNSIRCVADAP